MFVCVTSFIISCAKLGIFLIKKNIFKINFVSLLNQVLDPHGILGSVRLRKAAARIAIKNIGRIMGLKMFQVSSLR